MNLIKSTYLVSILAILLFSGSSLLAQDRVIINQAEAAVGVTIDGEQVRKILNDVILRTDDMVMSTDSAYQYIDRDLLVTYNTQIETEEEVIWADTIYYDIEREYSRLRGRVIIRSENSLLFSDSMDVDMANDITTFEVPVRFEDDRGTLIAENGIYLQEADSAVFRGNVQLSDSTQYLEADSLFMNRADDLYELFGRVYANDFEDDVRFSGEYLYADSTGYRLLRNSAWLMEVDESKSDTTHLFAEKVELFETDSLSTMDAFGDVRIWSPDFSAVADTLLFNEQEERFILRSDPALWQQSIQLTGPYIEARFENDSLRFMTSYPRPIIVQEDSLTDRLHQMAGDTLNAWFENQELQRVRVFDNAEIIFHQTDENDEPDGLIEMFADGAATMFFENGDFDFFRANNNINGSYLPENPEIIDRQLDNFNWTPGRRPEKPEPRSPRLPPITDTLPFELPPRYLIFLENLEGEVIEPAAEDN